MSTTIYFVQYLPDGPGASWQTISDVEDGYNLSKRNRAAGFRSPVDADDRLTQITEAFPDNNYRVVGVEVPG